MLVEPGEGAGIGVSRGRPGSWARHWGVAGIIDSEDVKEGTMELGRRATLGRPRRTRGRRWVSGGHRRHNWNGYLCRCRDQGAALDGVIMLRERHSGKVQAGMSWMYAAGVVTAGLALALL
ncbi:hypothetical protein MLD38_000312 [Melastoma candidum]|uniref:Uncharacterized protein n=1 Tax=Melastoma candidum TaxID=119954 RepID=A0ACB9S9T2_9MYRT|nr:hypothetical protein MLD38_000312 [Melastoma candidum]